MPPVIGLAARAYDPEGALVLPWRDGTNVGDLTRRVSRTRTLDGGVAVTDRGHAAGDRTLTVSLEGRTISVVERVRRLLRLHGQVTVSLDDGCYTATLSEYNERRQELTVLILGTA
ncbi:hypothetical protein [Halomonas salina]|uniref:Uncharacterized protein n=1 Tax=Halomonas salina TaxID=42565 RepID=A0ABR4WU84_9GAMM|nr:hypothetical protein [Halomonas salina]KGE78277.1 hypothetical protein FP66_04595 [Halomonas salina]